jgi:hypothetical protein
MSLPPLLTVMDRDTLHSVDENGKLTVLISPFTGNIPCAASVNGIDLHIMNKQSIIRNAESLLRLT